MPSYTFNQYFDDFDLDVEVEIEVTTTENYKGDLYCPPNLEWEVDSVHVYADFDADPEKVAELTAELEAQVKAGDYDSGISDACSDYDLGDDYDHFDDYYDR